MSKKRGVAVATVLTTAALVGATAGVSYADLSYAPTTLGNPDYTNYVDPLNDIQVAGIDATTSISRQNAETQQLAAEQALQLGAITDVTTPVLLTNRLDQPIPALAFHTTATGEYGENLLTGQLEAGASAGWNVDESAYSESTVTNKHGVTAQIPDNYLIQATLADGTVAEFHNVNMAGVETVDLCYSADYEVFYVTVTRINQHTPDPNINYELDVAAGKEANFQTNSAARYAADKEITASRGGGWDTENLKLTSGGTDWSHILDFGVYVPLFGEPSLDYTDGVYEELYWNPDQHLWRGTNGDTGTWSEAVAPAGAGEFGDGDASVANVDYHPGMDEGDWTYVTEGTAD